MSGENKDAEAGAHAAKPSSEGEAPEGGASVKLDKFDGDAAKDDATGEPASAETSVETEIAEPAEPAALAARIAQLQAELSAKEDQHLRAVAEVQNIRRRAERDRRDAEQYGGTKLARDMLPVFDNLDEALRQASDALKENEAGFFNGVELTRKGLLDALGKSQITQIKPELGEKFDPNLHQAMFEAPTPGATPGTVIQVMKSGFKIGDRLLRAAMVGVASAQSGSAPEGSNGAGGGENQAADA